MSEVRQFRVEPGEEVIETIAKHVANAGIRNGAVVSLIGAVDSCCISNMPKADAKSDVLTEYTQPFELSGTGEITAGKVHLHVSLSGEGDSVLHGHLHRANVENWYVAAYVIAYD